MSNLFVYSEKGEARGLVSVAFDDYDKYDFFSFGKITKITIYSGNLVNGIKVFYAGGQVKEHGYLIGNESTIDLADDEYVTQVRLRTGWLVDQLSIVTNKGDRGSFGGGGGVQSAYDFSGNGLIAFRGKKTRINDNSGAIGGIGFVTADPNEFLTEPSEEQDNTPNDSSEPSNSSTPSSSNALFSEPVSIQQTFLKSRVEKTPADSTLYLSRSAFKNREGADEHLIVGVNIKLSPDHDLCVDDSEGIVPGTRVATKSLTVCCDTLEVHGKFYLPEADITIYSQKLIWKDFNKNGAILSPVIDTTPQIWKEPAKSAEVLNKDKGDDGVDGRNAGNLTIYVSEVEDLSSSDDPRIVARGGRGQDPGAGKDGVDGKSMTSWSSFEERWRPYLHNYTVCRGEFSPPSVYTKFNWKFDAREINYTRGEDAFPTDGTPPKAPGVPGNGGNGGGLTTNLYSLLKSFNNDGGSSGTTARNYHGGRAGTPTHSAHYGVWCQYDSRFILDFRGDTYTQVQPARGEERRTKGFDDAIAQPASRIIGDASVSKVLCGTNKALWLHPLSLQKAIEYARDLFLAEDREALQQFLTPYAKAIALGSPNTDAWASPAAQGQWNSARHEIIGMQQRLGANLDYFGNPGGFIPFLSLASATKLYKNEIRRSLRMMLLVKWLERQQKNATQLVNTFDNAIATAKTELDEALKKARTAKSDISRLSTQIDRLKGDLKALTERLAKLQEKLLEEAQDNVNRRAQIKFGIKIATAICQVIPVGQPVLGGVTSSLSAVASGLAENDGAVSPETVAQLATVFDTVNEIATSKDEESPSEDEESSSEEHGYEKLTQIGAGISPALSELSEGLQALQVPASEVEAELQRLASQNEEWNNLVNDIRELNEDKAGFADALKAARQTLDDSYARVSENASAIISMRQQRSTATNYVDPMTLGLVQQLGQRSRLALTRYLYIMVKAYETTVFEPLNDVNWKLDSIADRIETLLSEGSNIEGLLGNSSEENARKAQQSLNKLEDNLESLFEENLEAIRRKLIDNFEVSENTLDLTLGLYATASETAQSPASEIIKTLNETGRVVFNPILSNFFPILNRYQRVRLSNVTITTIDFEGSGLPSGYNLIIDLKPLKIGTIRKEQHLYNVYSEKPLSWSWVYSGRQDFNAEEIDDLKLKASERSEASQDVLDSIVGEGAKEIRQKVALPPVWSDMELSISFNPILSADKRPKISKLYFKFSCDRSFAPDNQRVVTVQSLGQAPGAIVECKPDDLADRNNGLDNLYRIYAAGTPVQLSVPNAQGGSTFSNWQLTTDRGRISKIDSPIIGLDVVENMLVQCYWQKAEKSDVVEGLFNSLEVVEPMESPQDTYDSFVAEAFVVRADDSLAEPVFKQGICIFHEPDANSLVLSAISSLDEAEIEAEIDGWKQVNYRGILGWVKNGATPH